MSSNRMSNHCRNCHANSPTVPYPDHSLQAFYAAHTGRGTLRVQVSTGGNTFPLSNATVEVAAVVNGTAHLLYSRKTDQSGIVDDLVLPAKPRAASQREETADESATLYTVTVSHPAFRTLRDERVVIYDGVETIFPAAMEMSAT